MIMLYITCRDDKEADVIAQHLINKKLIACANIFPIKSIYRWKGEIAAEKEVVMIAKTTDRNHKEAEKEIKKIHSYDVPCIIRINADANKEYLSWLEGKVK